MGECLGEIDVLSTSIFRLGNLQLSGGKLQRLTPKLFNQRRLLALSRVSLGLVLVTRTGVYVNGLLMCLRQ